MKMEGYKVWSGPIIIWGLRNTQHTHRFIHNSFFRCLKKSGAAVQWLDDEPGEHHKVPRGAVIITSNIEFEHLPRRPDLRYVSHNLPEPTVSDLDRLSRGHLKLQVWTKNSKGKVVGNTKTVTFDSESRTLYQPWGTPWSESEWLQPSPNAQARRRYEFWIGSIWNNERNQGNEEAISKWRLVLQGIGTKFVPVPHGWPDSQISYSAPIRFSRFGASIVGDWQQEHEYIPCRVFKNLSAGVLPAGNTQALKNVFGEYSVVHENLEDLVSSLVALSTRDKFEMILLAQEILKDFTFEASLERIFQSLQSIC